MKQTRPRRGGIRTRLTLTHVVTAFISVVILMAIVRFTLIREFEKYIQQDQQQLMSSLQMQADSCYDAAGNLKITSSLEQLGEFALERGIILQFKSTKGQILWCMHCEEEAACKAILSQVEANTMELCHDMTGTYVEKEYPVTRNEVQAGTIVIGSYSPFFYTDREAEFLRNVQWGFGISFAVVVLISLMVGILISGVLSRPIRSVVEQTGRINRQEYDQRVEIHSRIREVEELALGINQLTNHLAHAEHTRRRMAGAYAHELRTPLSTLELTLGAMMDGVWEATPERLASCEEEVARITRMLSNIEKLVEAEDPNQEIHRTQFDMYLLVQQVIKAHQVQIDGKHQTIDLTGESSLILADEDKMRQVLTNLLTNAIKYTQEKGSIQFTVRISGEELSLEIKDNGMGIHKEDCPYIFDYMYRTDESRSRETGGSGIGLSIVKAIVEAHHGRVEVESTYGKGTTFRIILPSS